MIVPSRVCGDAFFGLLLSSEVAHVVLWVARSVARHQLTLAEFCVSLPRPAGCLRVSSPGRAPASVVPDCVADPVAWRARPCVRPRGSRLRRIVCVLWELSCYGIVATKRTTRNTTLATAAGVRGQHRCTPDSVDRPESI